MAPHTVSERLNQIMAEKNLRQVDVLKLCRPLCLIRKVKLQKSDLSQYISGKTVPGEKKLAILAMALEVNEPWLLGYDVEKLRR